MPRSRSRSPRRSRDDDRDRRRDDDRDRRRDDDRDRRRDDDRDRRRDDSRDRRGEEERYPRETRPRDRSPHPAENWGKSEAPKKGTEEGGEEKAKPNFGLSGKLAAETNTYKGIVLKYNEPAESRKPTLRWRLYPLKGDEALEPLHIHRQSAYLIGREAKVVSE
jgi:smad nuclear-interacting protein 1